MSYTSIEKLFNLSDESKVKNCGTPIVVENYAQSTKQQNNFVSRKIVNPAEEFFNTKQVNVHTQQDGGYVDHSVDPNLWGPHQWKALHYNAVGYEDNPNKYVQSLMKGRLMALPIELCCLKCRSHCSMAIESANLDDVVSSRQKLFRFYFDFHNKVNTRLGKPVMSYEEACAMYNFH